MKFTLSMRTLLRGRPLIKRYTGGSQLIFSLVPLIKARGGSLLFGWELMVFPEKNYLIKLNPTLNLN